jgi:hypothetical protein
VAERFEKPALTQGNMRRRSRVPAMSFALLTFACDVHAQLASRTPDHTVDHLGGIVVNSITHEPIGRALVLSSDNHFATMTDDRGRFAFTFAAAQARPVQDRAADPSQMQNVSLTRPTQLTARKVGFLAAAEGQEFYEVNPDQQELTISLVPEARIVGHVIIPGFDSFSKMQVELYRRAFREGREEWESAGNVSTRADGEFRIAELRPGSYKLLTLENLDHNPLNLKADGQLLGYPPAYYPRASDFATAAIIHLKAGETFQSSISPVKREYYPVNLPFATPLASPQLYLKVWPQGHPGPGYSLGYDPRDGTIQGFLPDGMYTLQATNFGPNVTGGTMNFTVAGAAVAGPAFTLVQASSITINVREEFQHQQTEPTVGIAGDTSFPQVAYESRRPSYLQVGLVPDEEFGLAAPIILRPSNNQDDESLVLENVLPGRYRVIAYSGIGYISSIASGGMDLLSQPLAVVTGASVPSIEITVRDDGAELEGTLDPTSLTPEHSFQPKSTLPVVPGRPQGFVYLVPIDKIDARPKIALFDYEGKFMLPQLAPGAYHAFAVDGPGNQMQWVSEEWLKQHESKVQIIHVVEGQKAHVRLALIKENE